MTHASFHFPVTATSMSLQALVACAALSLSGAAAADPLAAPSLAGPLQANGAPAAFDAGPLGKVWVGGQLSAIGLLQNHAVDAAGYTHGRAAADVGNAQVELQTIEGPVQFYLQGGAYALPALGSPYLKARASVDALYGPLPVAYVKFVLAPDVSVLAGALPTLVGAESTFTFQNMNIQRGLLWNQEPAISRGVQVNAARGPVSAALALNDGYYSGKYNWLAGSLAYAATADDTVTIVAAGNLSRNAEASAVTPLAQNNSRIVNLIYAHTQGALTLSPYLQYTQVRRDVQLGIAQGASTMGAALLAKYAGSDGWSVGARAEWLHTTGACGGAAGCTPTNLLYGAGSSAWSLTVTPTWQAGRLFARAEVGYVRARHAAAGAGFGSAGARSDQARALVETGLLF
jgi:hypothetical protein